MESNILNQSQQQIGHVSCTQVSAKEFAAKFQSKRECYTFLASDCEVYLPPYGKSTFHPDLFGDVNSFFLLFFQTISRSTS